MQVLLVGATGFIGSKMLESLLQHQHNVYALVRNPLKAETLRHLSINTLIGDARENGPWIAQLPDHFDAILNFAQTSLAGRFSRSMIESNHAHDMLRIAKNLHQIAQRTQTPVLVQPVSIGSYGRSGDALSEHSQYTNVIAGLGLVHNKALGYLGKQSDITLFTPTYGCFVYSADKNYLNQLAPKISDQIYAVAGKGNNLWQLTHCEDAANAVVFALENNLATGALNIVDDEAVTQKQFIHIIANINNKKVINIPEFAAKLKFGEFLTDRLTHSHTAKNQKLKSAGYFFKYPNYAAGLATLIGNLQH